MLKVPLTNDPKQTLSFTVGDREYTINVRWSTVMESWYMDVMDAAGSHLLRGQRLCGDWPIPRHRIEGKGLWDYGYMICYTNDGMGATDPGRDAWLETHTLLFVSYQETGVVL